jgi:hypothetical protein
MPISRLSAACYVDLELRQLPGNNLGMIRGAGITRIRYHAEIICREFPKTPSLGRNYPASTVLRAYPPPRAARPIPHGRPVEGHAPSPPGVSRVALISLYRHAVVITPVARWVGLLVKQRIPAVYIARQRLRPSPSFRKVGVHIGRFEACSTFTRVTACLLAASPSDTLFSKAPTVSLPPPPLR